MVRGQVNRVKNAMRRGGLFATRKRSLSIARTSRRGRKAVATAGG
jgi:hypothetical protein